MATKLEELKAELKTATEHVYDVRAWDAAEADAAYDAYLEELGKV